MDSQHPESESNDIFQASEFVELDIPHVSKHQITVGIDRKELIIASGLSFGPPCASQIYDFFRLVFPFS